MYGRLSALPDEAEPLQGGQLIAAIAIALFPRAKASSATSSSAASPRRGAVWRSCMISAPTESARLRQLDRRLASHPGAWPETAITLRVRGHILVISDALAEHASYFDAGAAA
jgi:hypothetical protein